jgi:serine O-acetyltransferase
MKLLDEINSDLYRYNGRRGPREFLYNLLLNPGFKYSLIMRLTKYSYGKKVLFIPWVIFFIILRHYQSKYGIQIPFHAKIGKGFYIGHFNSIVVSNEATIGDNCNISHDVTIGRKNRGPMKGFPVIGNNVYIAPGAKIIGLVRIGNNVVIGSNAVVTRDVPDNAVVVGIPARIISYDGSKDYVNNTDY